MAAPPPPLPQGPPPPNPAFFVDTKKGEVSELKQLLKNISIEKDPKRKRDVIKKVIAYMTLGIDVSRLFTEMVMAIETRDLVVKKMVYLYLCNYAHAKPDLAIMCVNTLQRDCSSDDPMVRGLALRSLCSLRLPSMVEYISEPLRRSLTDISAYVRRTGVMGILKLYHLAPDMVKGSNMIDLLYNMIQDPDAQVVMNCVLVLNEILADEGGMVVNQALILHLLNKVNEFNEWGLIQVLSLVPKYQPADEDETFSIMNLLDPVLRTSNAGVVLAVVKCFIHLTFYMPDLQQQVYGRLKAPLLTLMAGGNPETDYVVLKHVEYMIPRCPGVFDDEYRQLYVKYNEPSYVKYEKIDLLAMVANELSVQDIVGELAEYASDVDQEVSRRSIRAIGKVAFRLPDAAAAIIGKLIEFLDLEVDNVRAETVLVMKDVLRKYPERRGDILPSLKLCLKKVDEMEAKGAVIWMTGEFGQELPEAPYMLEPLIDGYADLGAAPIKLSLLTATLKLFFKRPGEVQSMLGRLLAAAVNDISSQDLHDRAMMYYRLLSANLEVARAVVLGPANKEVVSEVFAEERDTGLREKLYAEEFNTLSILYGKASTQFVSPTYQFKLNLTATSATSQHDLSEDSLLDHGNLGERSRENSLSSPQRPYTGPSVDLLDMGGLGDALPSSTQPPSSSIPPPAMSPPSFELAEGVTLDPDTFQSLWTQFPDTGTFNVDLQRLPSSPAELEASLASNRIMTLASGDLPDIIKFLLYAQDLDGNMYLVQAVITKVDRRMDVSLKTDATPVEYDPADAFIDKISASLMSLSMI